MACQVITNEAVGVGTFIMSADVTFEAIMLLHNYLFEEIHDNTPIPIFMFSNSIC